MEEYTIQDIDKQINEILNGTKDLPKFNQSEHAGVCSAGPLLIGALLVCDIARESLTASGDAGNCQATPGVNYISERLVLEDMHPANVFVESHTGLPMVLRHFR